MKFVCHFLRSQAISTPEASSEKKWMEKTKNSFAFLSPCSLPRSPASLSAFASPYHGLCARPLRQTYEGRGKERDTEFEDEISKRWRKGEVRERERRSFAEVKSETSERRIRPGGKRPKQIESSVRHPSPAGKDVDFNYLLPLSGESLIGTFFCC